MTDQAKFWDGLAEKYAKDPIADVDGYNYTLKRTRSYLRASDTVLELGCGTGSTALELAQSVAHITASDISANMIGIANDKLEASGTKNINFVVGDVFSDANGTTPYDAVLAHNLLHLMDDVPAALNQIADFLKPGGIFVSKTFCIDPGRQSMKVKFMRLALPLLQAIGKAPQVTFLSSTQLETMIEAAGFKLLETGNYPSKEPRRYIVASKNSRPTG